MAATGSVYSLRKRGTTGNHYWESIQYSAALMRSNLGGTFYCFIILYFSTLELMREGGRVSWSGLMAKERIKISFSTEKKGKLSSWNRRSFSVSTVQLNQSMSVDGKSGKRFCEKCETTKRIKQWLRWDVVRWWKKARKINLHLNKTTRSFCLEASEFKSKSSKVYKRGEEFCCSWKKEKDTCRRRCCLLWADDVLWGYGKVRFFQYHTMLKSREYSIHKNSIFDRWRTYSQ